MALYRYGLHSCCLYRSASVVVSAVSSAAQRLNVVEHPGNQTKSRDSLMKIIELAEHGCLTGGRPFNGLYSYGLYSYGLCIYGRTRLLDRRQAVQQPI